MYSEKEKTWVAVLGVICAIGIVIFGSLGLCVTSLSSFCDFSKYMEILKDEDSVKSFVKEIDKSIKTEAKIEDYNKDIIDEESALYIANDIYDSFGEADHPIDVDYIDVFVDRTASNLEDAGASLEYINSYTQSYENDVKPTLLSMNTSINNLDGTTVNDALKTFAKSVTVFGIIGIVIAIINIIVIIFIYANKYNSLINLGISFIITSILSCFAGAPLFLFGGMINSVEALGSPIGGLYGLAITFSALLFVVGIILTVMGHKRKKAANMY